MEIIIIGFIGISAVLLAVFFSDSEGRIRRLYRSDDRAFDFLVYGTESWLFYGRDEYSPDDYQAG